MTPRDAQCQYPVPAQDHLLKWVRLSPRQQVLGWQDKSGARLEWVQMDVIWASPEGNRPSVQQQTSLDQKCTHLPQTECEVTDQKYSEKKSNGKPLLSELEVMTLNCQFNSLYFDFEWDIDKKQVLLYGQKFGCFLVSVYRAKISHKPYLKPVPL